MFRALRAPLFLLLALSAFTASCAQERDPIDRVQPWALDKTLFVGKDLVSTADDPEFWAQATLVDVGYGASQDGLFTSTYAQPVSRIKWQITEGLLIGRLAYERIEGSDGKGLGKATQDGVIVCAFRIESHFDIKRSYNSTTGEEMNILEENNYDRPWYQRTHMRVDWSKNLNTDSYDFDTLSMVGIYGGVQYEPMAYNIQDPNDPNAPYFAADNTYFDITSKAFAKPGVVDLSHLGWGIDSFPACFLDADFSGGTAPTGSCNPIELTVRHAFRRVVASDFEPRDYDGFRFQAFGGFTTERSGYTRNYGMTDAKWYRFLNYYNIWDRSHYYANPAKMEGFMPCYTPTTTPFGADPHRDLDKDGTEDECQAVDALVGAKGARCDTFKQRCALPLTVRTPKPLAWYYTSGSNLEYFDATEQATNEWDVALRVGIRGSQLAECNRVGGASCAERFPVYDGQADDNGDAIALAIEVDDCRNGRAYTDLGRNELLCQNLADSVGQKRGYSAGVIAIAKMPEMLVLCHSPVEAGDPAGCGKGTDRLPPNVSAVDCEAARVNADEAVLKTCRKALNVRRGDLRYHQVNGIVEPQTPSPWGIMVDSNDPLTGETLAASINVWTYVNELWSQGVVDQARFIAGELKTENVTEGTYIKDWSEAAKAASANGMLPGLSAEEHEDRVGDTDGRHMDAAHAAQFEQQHPKAVQAMGVLKEQMKGVTASSKAATTSAPLYAARRQLAMGTIFEASLMTPAVQMLAGMVGMPLGQAVLDLASPLRGGNPSVQRELRRMKENAMAERGTCIMQMAEAPLSIAGLGDILQEKFGKFDPTQSPEVQQARAEKMRQYVARKAQYAVIGHEMGHSIGLRHNFISSSDPVLYRPQYWQLRTKDGTVKTECKALAADGSTCVGPRFFDPVTKEERDNLIWMWMQSSIMDYAGETTQDMIGLGAYDFAATRMLYGDSVAVFADPSYKGGTPRGKSMLGKLDNFGGILGLEFSLGTKTIHYSQLQLNYDLISGCKEVNPLDFKPARYNESVDGSFHPVLDGLIVKVNEKYTRCRQQKVDYVPWTSLRAPTTAEGSGGGNAAIDAQGRPRVPYGFATDNWADLGNLSVYRHDNGADPYEIFNFMITMQEVNHIFDNYRRGRKTFSVRGAANRALTRFNEKMRDGAKGLALYRNIYRDIALEFGADPDELWAYAARTFFPDNVLASGIVFDHFAKQMARPESGEHYSDGSGVLRSMEAKQSSAPVTVNLIVPNGATGYYGQVTYGGRPVENRLANDKGEYDSEYTVNAGSYYDKMYVSMLMTESVDNFISASLGDFVDARYRATSLADLFPDGYRRFLANFLTGDDFIKGPRLAAGNNGKPLVDAQKYPTGGFGWTTWFGTEPTSCFPSKNSTVCTSYGATDNTPYGAQAPAKTVIVDPQVGWEQQKFLIAWTMLYLPENAQQGWLDMMRVWELGKDAEPGITARIEFHDPIGKVYIAHRLGRETIFGKTVEKGIAARVLEYANLLLKDGYETTPGPDQDGDGIPDWYLPVIGAKTGEPQVKFDPAMGNLDGGPIPGCTATDNSGCKCQYNRACMKLKQYSEVPYYLREAMDAYGLGGAHPKGIY
ncbi:MAG: hypothetical protein ACOYOB_05880 [Myxococcota bacterium]